MLRSLRYFYSLYPTGRFNLASTQFLSTSLNFALLSKLISACRLIAKTEWLSFEQIEVFQWSIIALHIHPRLSIAFPPACYFSSYHKDRSYYRGSMLILTRSRCCLIFHVTRFYTNQISSKINLAERLFFKILHQ